MQRNQRSAQVIACYSTAHSVMRRTSSTIVAESHLMVECKTGATADSWVGISPISAR